MRICARPAALHLPAHYPCSARFSPCPALQSFNGVQLVGGDKLLVPANALDQWYLRLESRLRRDPDWLTRQRQMV